jgi:outer membrane protein TolC
MLAKLIRTIIVFSFTGAIAFAQTNLSLNDCKNLALKNNAKIKNAKLDIKASQEVKDAAYTKYFPNASFNMTYVHALDDLIQMTQKGGNLPVYDGNPANLQHPTQFAYMPDTKLSLIDKVFDASIMVTQPIYAGGRISAGNELADIGVEINKSQLSIQQNNILQKTEELYWTHINLLEKTNTILFYENFLKTLLKDVNSAYNAGLIGKNDVLKVSLKLNELKINQVKLNNAISLTKEALCQHIGIDYDPNIRLSDTTMDIKSPEEYFKNPDNAIQDRHEMKMLNSAVKAEALQTEMTKGELLPEIGGGMILDYMNIMDKGIFNCILFAKVSVPITGWWEGSHKVEEKKIKEEMIRITKNETSELLKVQMSKTWKDLSEAFNQIKLGEDMEKQAQENFKVNESNYKSGMISISDYLEAQAALREAQDQITEFKTNYKIALANYLISTGAY